jgi:hypothetical protein
MPPSVVTFVYFSQRRSQGSIPYFREQPLDIRSLSRYTTYQDLHVRTWQAPAISVMGKYKNSVSSITSLLLSLHLCVYVCVACQYRAFFAYRYILAVGRWILLLHNDWRCRTAAFTTAQSGNEKRGWHFKGLLNGEFWIGLPDGLL